MHTIFHILQNALQNQNLSLSTGFTIHFSNKKKYIKSHLSFSDLIYVLLEYFFAKNISTGFICKKSEIVVYNSHFTMKIFFVFKLTVILFQFDGYFSNNSLTEHMMVGYCSKFTWIDFKYNSLNPFLYVCWMLKEWNWFFFIAF